MKLIVRSRRGFTKRLYEHAARAGNDGECRVSVWVDGPYGPPTHVHGYPTVVLIAGMPLCTDKTWLHPDLLSGGSGVTFTLPLMLDVVR